MNKAKLQTVTILFKAMSKVLFIEVKKSIVGIIVGIVVF